MALPGDLRGVDGQLREARKEARYRGPGQRSHPGEPAWLIRIVSARWLGRVPAGLTAGPVSRLVAVLRAGPFKEPGGRSSLAASSCGLVPAVQPGGALAACR
jgi:hypothetical protein